MASKEQIIEIVHPILNISSIGPLDKNALDVLLRDIDSLEFLGVILDIESAVSKKFKTEITLVGTYEYEFSTFGTLTDYIVNQLCLQESAI
jgi:acyl carrier protein